jgi:hypothetical protein
MEAKSPTETDDAIEIAGGHMLPASQSLEDRENVTQPKKPIDVDPSPKALRSSFGERPECFKNTFQEVGFVLMATMATATASFLTGATVIVTASIGHDLGMTQSEISWIGAATS